MSTDPLLGVKILRMRLEDRLHEISRELDAFEQDPHAIDSLTKVSIAQDDIDQGWRQAVSALEHFASLDPAMTYELMVGLERLTEGFFTSGTLLTRDSSASRRFGSKAPATARAARARKIAPLHQIQADIIALELVNARKQSADLSLDKLAGSILDSVNARLRERHLEAISKTTIWRRICNFNL